MVKVYDLEVLSNYFLYVDLESGITDEYISFEISKFKNQYNELIHYLKEVKGLIGFNNINYDSQILEFLIRNKYFAKIEDGEKIAEEIYRFSNEIINQGKPTYWENDLSIHQLDPFKILHYDNKARSCSLKWAQFSMDWHNIQDMPIDHWTRIEDPKTSETIIEYCKNDCASTKQLYNIIKGNTTHPLYKSKDKVQLRKDVEKQFGFRCINFSDVKLGDELNKTNYSKVTGISTKSLKYITKNTRSSFTYEECFPDYIEFKTEEFKAFINSFRKERVDLANKQEFKFKYNKTTYTVAKGGLHSNEGPRLIEPTNYQILRDADVGSMYPNAIGKRRIYPPHLNEKWLDGYVNTIKLRLDAKEKFKETNDPKWESIAETYKLALNSSFGKLQEETNWQYDPFSCFKVTVGCQIDLLMLIESLEMAGISVMSANTDGIVSLFEKDQENIYKNVCKEWEKKVGNDVLGKLEYKDYKVLAQRSVNHYIAIDLKNESKTKGCFLIDYELHKNKSFKIIPLALEAFYKSGINPVKFIKEHTNIFDFCAGIRAKGGAKFVTHEMINGEYKQETLQKTVRYFISNKGCKLIKMYDEKRKEQVEAGKWLCTIYNKHKEQPIGNYNINYDYYINKTYEIISEIQPEIINKNYTQLSIF